jgi:hypothetical protein
LLEHYAEHVGQMSLTRQVWEEQAKTPKRQPPARKRQTRQNSRPAKDPKRSKNARRIKKTRETSA